MKPVVGTAPVLTTVAYRRPGGRRIVSAVVVLVHPVPVACRSVLPVQAFLCRGGGVVVLRVEHPQVAGACRMEIKAGVVLVGV